MQHEKINHLNRFTGMHRQSQRQNKRSEEALAESGGLGPKIS